MRLVSWYMLMVLYARIMKIVIRILNGENSQDEINKTFIVLIPKIQNPSMWCIKLPQKYLQIV
jgi:hypothetical protein